LQDQIDQSRGDLRKKRFFNEVRQETIFRNAKILAGESTQFSCIDGLKQADFNSDFSQTKVRCAVVNFSLRECGQKIFVKRDSSPTMSGGAAAS
jgi:hypothetical protein